jgi:hypothetical protein
MAAVTPCPQCGAAVTDEDKHREWHAALDERVRTAGDGHTAGGKVYH